MPKKKSCIFTIVKNESIFLPIWLKYYSKFFDAKDIYVLDHDSDDQSIEKSLNNYKFNIIKAHHNCYDDIWRIKKISEQQVELLKSYDYVLYSDADEILIADPKKYKDLREYIQKCKKDCVTCSGYEMIHVREREPKIDLTRPILEQRKYWYKNNYYDKPLLSKKPLNWCAGLHSAENNECHPDKELWLIHLHRLDFDLCWQKHQNFLKLEWSQECIKQGFGFQLRITNLKDFTKFFDTRHPDYKKLTIIDHLYLLPFWYMFTLVKSIKNLIFKKPLLKLRNRNKNRYPIITRIPAILVKSKII